jgi:hypothetical protein
MSENIYAMLCPFRRVVSVAVILWIFGGGARTTFCGLQGPGDSRSRGHVSGLVNQRSSHKLPIPRSIFLDSNKQHQSREHNELQEDSAMEGTLDSAARQP